MKKDAKEGPASGANIAITAGDPRKDKLCWHFRDHGSCSKGSGCPYSHDKELRKRELERLKQQGKGGQGGGAQPSSSALPAKGGGKGGKGPKPKAKAEPKKQAERSDKPDKSQKQCPFFAKRGACKKGDSCDMSHTLAASTAASSSGTMPAGWGPPAGQP